MIMFFHGEAVLSEQLTIEQVLRNFKKLNATSSVRLQAARAHKALPHILDLDEITFLWLTRMTMAKEFLSTLNTQTLTCALGRWTAHLDTMLFLFVIGNLFAIFSRRAKLPVFLTNLVVLAMRRAV